MLGILEYKFPNSFLKYLTSPLTVTSGPYQPRVSLLALHCLAVSFSFCKPYGTFHLALSSLNTCSNSHHDNTFPGSKYIWVRSQWSYRLLKQNKTKRKQTEVSVKTCWPPGFFNLTLHPPHFRFSLILDFKPNPSSKEETIRSPGQQLTSVAFRQSCWWYYCNAWGSYPKRGAFTFLCN